MQLLNVTNLPIYLPYDTARAPFGDPIEGVTATLATPGIVTVPGYLAPVAGDAIALTFLAGGSIPTGLSPGITYYVVAPIVNNTFALAATKGGAAIATTSTGANLVAHLLSNQVDGVTLPFKPNNTVLVENNSGGTLALQGAADLNVGVGPPQGPGSWNTLQSLTTGQQSLVGLTYDWLRVSTAGTLSLMQN
jgi:hypothetical protein